MHNPQRNRSKSRISSRWLIASFEKSEALGLSGADGLTARTVEEWGGGKEGTEAEQVVIVRSAIATEDERQVLALRTGIRHPRTSTLLPVVYTLSSQEHTRPSTPSSPPNHARPSALVIPASPSNTAPLTSAGASPRL